MTGSAVLSILACCTASFIFAVSAERVWEEISSVFSLYGASFLYAEIVLKIIGIAFLSNMVSDICIDSDEKGLAKSAVFLGKISILLLCIPIIGEAVDIIKNLLVF